MYTYSHLLWAHKLCNQLGVRHPEEFYLGAVTPDMRYVDGTPWSQTHPPLEEMWERVQSNGFHADTRDRDFALGYLLHLAMDEEWSWLSQEVRRRHPLGRLLPVRVVKLSIELAAVEQYPLESLPMTRRIPPFTAAMGISPDAVRLVRDHADRALSNPTDVENAHRFVRETGLDRVRYIRTLLFLSRVILRTPLRRLLLGPIRRTLVSLETELARRFLSHLEPFVEITSPVEEIEKDVLVSLAP